VSNFIRQAVMGEPLTIYGDGSQTRSFCFVDEMIDAFRRMMDSPEEFTGPVNLGNPHEFSMLELAREVARHAGRACDVRHLPLPSDDPVQRRPDISLARRVLGWEPTIGIDEGIPRTIEWFRSVRLEDYPPPSPNVMQPEAQAGKT
jgi:UDP-glucuronate decarboxylase